MFKVTIVSYEHLYELSEVLLLHVQDSIAGGMGIMTDHITTILSIKQAQIRVEGKFQRTFEVENGVILVADNHARILVKSITENVNA